MHRGFIVLWRKFLDSSFYTDHYAVRLAIHLLLKSNHEPKKIIFNGNLITIDRGQLITGRNVLAAELKMDSSNVRNKLVLLKNSGFLDIKSNNKFSLITVCNYDTYQKVKQQNGQQLGQPEDTINNTTIQPLRTTKQKNMSPAMRACPFDFEALWAKYPNKDGKKLAQRSFISSVKSQKDYEDIQTALSNYLQSERVTKGFIKNGSTWFNNWHDWINYSGSKEIESEAYKELKRMLKNEPTTN